LDIVLQWWRVKDDPLLLPDFINDVLAECWEEVRDKPEPHYLMQRAEPWEFGHIPERVYFLTAAADIQGNRIEAELMGWGANKEGWILDYRVWDGNTEDPGDPCWNHLAEFIEEERVRADGVMLGGPVVTLVDAGFLQSVVNHFCDMFPYSPRVVNGVYPVIGRESMGNHAYKTESNDIKTPLLAIDDQKFKKVVYSYLRREPPPEGSAYPNGYIHFPSSLGETYYQQLTAEDWIETTNRDGKKISKIANPHQRRNEALDVTKLNYAALYYMCLHWYEVQNKKRKTKHLRELEINWATFLEGMKPDATVQ
jgi:phage terminase large subunit GpA-like protein